jgi:hypothetical protein
MIVAMYLERALSLIVSLGITLMCMYMRVYPYVLRVSALLACSLHSSPNVGNVKPWIVPVFSLKFLIT